jgi:hypothetical protein
MSRWMLIAALSAGMISWVNALWVLGKLKTQGYQYSDLFSSKIYERCWQVAPERGWSRIPLFVIPTALVLCLSLFLMAVISI